MARALLTETMIHVQVLLTPYISFQAYKFGLVILGSL
jgi:hypothetical protein